MNEDDSVNPRDSKLRLRPSEVILADIGTPTEIRDGQMEPAKTYQDPEDVRTNRMAINAIIKYLDSTTEKLASAIEDLKSKLIPM